MGTCPHGDLPASFEGTGWQLFKRTWWLWLLSLPIITLPFTYPAYQAILWRWWVSGVSFGKVRFDSDLRAGRLMGLYWTVIGWIILLVVVDIIVITIVITAIVHFGTSQTTASVMLLFARQHPYLMLGANIANYLVVALCAGILARVYLVRGLWERVVTSVTAHNLDGADNVRARGMPASALGEGFADALDVAGL
jgi:uncharacterized membrane protein YjgN (DUF898 family)